MIHAPDRQALSVTAGELQHILFRSFVATIRSSDRAATIVVRQFWSNKYTLPELAIGDAVKPVCSRQWNDRYIAQRLRKLSEDIRSQKWSEAYVIFMHEDEGISPKLATHFMKQCEP